MTDSQCVSPGLGLDVSPALPGVYRAGYRSFYKPWLAIRKQGYFLFHLNGFEDRLRQHMPWPYGEPHLAAATAWQTWFNHAGKLAGCLRSALAPRPREALLLCLWQHCFQALSSSGKYKRLNLGIRTIGSRQCDGSPSGTPETLGGGGGSLGLF